MSFAKTPEEIAIESLAVVGVPRPTIDRMLSKLGPQLRYDPPLVDLDDDPECSTCSDSGTVRRFIVTAEWTTRGGDMEREGYLAYVPCPDCRGGE